MGWKVMWIDEDSPRQRLRYGNPDTGEIIERDGGVDGLLRDFIEYKQICEAVARALGEQVCRDWEDDEPLDLAAEVRRLVGDQNAVGDLTRAELLAKLKEAEAEVERLQNESAGHTADECEADAIQAECEALVADLNEVADLSEDGKHVVFGKPSYISSRIGVGVGRVPRIAEALRANKPQEARP